MITNLSIKNYALIDDISVNFISGLTIITGETGAGKSILLGALSLLLGKRADLGSVKNNTEKCIVEGEFTLEEPSFKTIFENNNLDFDTHTIVRRELLPSGKSRAFVNDTPVTLAQLQILAPYLVDIHSQHETLELFSEKFQLEVIDTLAENTALLKEYTVLLNNYQKISEKIIKLEHEKETASKELDYNTFLHNELAEANLAETNQESLEKLFEVLNNTETIKESLSQVTHLLSEEQIGSLETIKESRAIIGKLRNFSSEFEELWTRLNSIEIELEDVFDTINKITLSTEADPSALYQVNEKLQILYKLQQKHTVNSVSELLKIENALASKIETTNTLDTKILSLKTEQKKLKSDTLLLAKKIHNKRIKVVPVLKEKLKVFLSDLGLPNADFKFEFSDSENFRKNGTDTLQLLFTANKGLAFGTLKKVASGGELSRLMLAIKAVLAQYKKLPALIFDEIDTGISGDIAYKMAAILNNMSKTMQLLCITHLPQIAAKGNHHIKIYKEDLSQTTTTRLTVLNKEERIAEIAEMIGGKKPTVTALNQAKEMFN